MVQASPKLSGTVITHQELPRRTALQQRHSIPSLYRRNKPPAANRGFIIEMSNSISGVAKALRAAPSTLRMPVQTSARRTLAFSHGCQLNSEAKSNVQCLLRNQKLGAQQGYTRAFSTSSPRYKLKTMAQIKTRNKSGVRMSLLPNVANIFFREFVLFASISANSCACIALQSHGCGSSCGYGLRVVGIL